MADVERGLGVDPVGQCVGPAERSGNGCEVHHGLRPVAGHDVERLARIGQVGGQGGGAEAAAVGEEIHPDHLVPDVHECRHDGSPETSGATRHEYLHRLVFPLDSKRLQYRGPEGKRRQEFWQVLIATAFCLECCA